MLQFVKRVAAIVLRFVFLIIVFVGLTYLDSSVTSVFDYLIYILFGALLLIGTYFNKQKAVLLIGLFLLMSAPLDIFGKGYFDDVIITNGIAVLLAISTLLGKSTLFRTFLKRHQLKIALGTGSTILTG